jgi:hypothetical protein
VTEQRPVSPPSVRAETDFETTGDRVRREAATVAQRSARHPASVEMARIERLANLLDTRFRLPGTSFRFGLDGLLGLIPGVGDLATALPALYFLYVARKIRGGRLLQWRIAGNAFIDFLLGSIPLVGDLFDFAFKSHQRNAALLRAALEKDPPPR